MCLPAAEKATNSDDPFGPNSCFVVSPVTELAVPPDNLLHEHEDPSNVRAYKDKPGEDDEDQVEWCAVLGSQDDLAEEATVFKEAHENEPVGDQNVLLFLHTSHVGKEEHYHCDDQTGEGYKRNVQIRN